MKKVSAFLLILVFSLNTFAVFANELMADDTEFVDYYEPQIKYEYITDKIKVDSAEYDVRQLVVNYDHGDEEESYGELYVEIAPLARAFKYNVSYVEETDTVVFEKDGTKKEISIQNSEIIENGDYDNWMYVDVISYEDRTYLSYSDVKKVIDGLYLNNDEWGYVPETEYSYHTSDLLIEQYKDIFKDFEKFYEINKGVYTSKSSAEMDVDFSVEDLGINVSGSCTLLESSLFENGKFCIDVSVDSDGLMNVIDLIMQISGDQETEVNFDEKTDFSIIFDSQNLYIKGDLNKLIIETEKPYFIDEEYELSNELKKMINEALNGWIKVEIDEGDFNYPVKTQDIIKMIAESNTTYEDKKQSFEIISGVMKYIASFVKETNQGYTCKINLNKSMLKAMFKLGNFEIPDELKGISVDAFNISSEDVYKKDGSGTSKSKADIKLSRIIPLNSKTRIGELGVKLTGNGIRKVSGNKVTAPEDFVSFETLREQFDILWNEY